MMIVPRAREAIDLVGGCGGDENQRGGGSLRRWRTLGERHVVWRGRWRVHLHCLRWCSPCFGGAREREELGVFRCHGCF